MRITLTVEGPHDLDNVACQMTPDQIVEAQRLSARGAASPCDGWELEPKESGELDDKGPVLEQRDPSELRVTDVVIDHE